MIDIILLIILSPISIICGLISMALIYAILKYIAKLIYNTAQTINDWISEMKNNVKNL